MKKETNPRILVFQTPVRDFICEVVNDNGNETPVRGVFEDIKNQKSPIRVSGENMKGIIEKTKKIETRKPNQRECCLFDLRYK